MAKFVAAGVRLVGGCCGTTPEHITVDEVCVAGKRRRGPALRPYKNTERRRGRSQVDPPPLAEALAAGRKIAAGEFVTMVEIVPPTRHRRRKRELEGAKFLKSVGVDAINIPDSPRASARMSNQALCPCW